MRSASAKLNGWAFEVYDEKFEAYSRCGIEADIAAQCSNSLQCFGVVRFAARRRLCSPRPRPEILSGVRRPCESGEFLHLRGQKWLTWRRDLNDFAPRLFQEPPVARRN
jgi:hypothetical protein